MLNIEIDKEALDPDSSWNSAYRKGKMERVTGVEPVSLAWEARVMPIYDTRWEG